MNAEFETKISDLSEMINIKQEEKTSISNSNVDSEIEVSCIDTYC